MMRKQRKQGPSRAAFAVATVAAALCASGCSADDGAPLGGPFGGTAAVPPPVDAAVNSTAGKQNRCKAVAGGEAGAPASAAIAGGDAGGDAGAEAGLSPDAKTAPTWAFVYGRYLQGCTGPGCHVEMTTSNGAYAWLKGKGYINGTTSNLVNPLTSCLKWYGGDMPPCGGDDPLAVADMNAWAAAGALNN
ncbi:MAG: hypothetical protein M3O50_21790 [Myxococcota bacterium]|nr:hypothetical protein [Myxococcota bacterium]